MKSTTADRATPTTTPDEAIDREVSLGGLAGVVAVGVAALAVAVFVSRVQEAIGLTVAAACLALVTLPIQRVVQRRIGSVGSLIASAITTFGLVVALAYVVLRDLRNQAEVVADLIRQRIDQIEPGSLADRVATALDLDQAIDEWIRRVPSLVVVGSDGGTQVGRQLFALFAVVILATFFQSSGRSIVDWIVARWPRDDPGRDDLSRDDEALVEDSGRPATRAQARSFLQDLERRGVGYVRRSLALAAAASALVWIACAVCGLPGAIAVALWAGVWFAVPAFGFVVGLLPIGLLVALDPRPAACLALALAAAVVLGATVARRRLVEPATLVVGVAPYILSVGLGVAIAGIGGSFVTLVIGTMVCAGLTSTSWPGRPPGWSLDPRHTRTIGGLTVPTGWRGAIVAMVMLGTGVIVWDLLHRLGPGIIWLLIGGFVAIALSRPIALLERRSRISRQAAATVLLVFVASILVLVTVAGVGDGARATTTVTERLPQVVADMENTRVIGPFLRDRGASVWVTQQMNDLPERLDRARPEEWLPTVGARLVDLFWTALFAMALLLDGPRLLAAAERRVPARHRRQYSRISAATGTALAGYAAGAALVASINASVVFTIALVLGVGLAPILAVWSFVWNFVPQIGGFMGGLPLVLFALVAGPLRGLAAGVLYVLYQLVENHLIQPAVIGAAINVAPWGTLIAALVGGAAAGVIGAVVLTPLVGVIRVIRAELARDDFPGATVRLEPTVPRVVEPVPG